MNKWHVKSPRFPELDKDIVEIYGKAGGAYLYNRGITDTAGAAAEYGIIKTYGNERLR